MSWIVFIQSSYGACGCSWWSASVLLKVRMQQALRRGLGAPHTRLSWESNWEQRNDGYRNEPGPTGDGLWGHSLSLGEHASTTWWTDMPGCQTPGATGAILSSNFWRPFTSEALAKNIVPSLQTGPCNGTDCVWIPGLHYRCKEECKLWYTIIMRIRHNHWLL